MAARQSNGTGGGLSNSPSSWAGGVVPVEGDSVTIVAGDTIELNATHVWGDDSITGIQVNGTLRLSRAASSQLTAKGHILINSGGTFDGGKTADNIPAAYHHVLILNYSAVMTAGKYGFFAKDASMVYWYGANAARNTYLTADAAVGATSIVVNDATGWEIGDTLALGTNESFASGHYTETRTISNIVGNTITIATLTYAHKTNTDVGWFNDNVLFKSYDATRGGFVCLYSSSSSPTAGTRYLKNASFWNLGSSVGQDTQVTSAIYKYGSLTLSTNGVQITTALYANISDMSFYRDTNPSNPPYAGYTHVGFCQPNITVNNLAIYAKYCSGLTGMSASFVNISNSVIYAAMNAYGADFEYGIGALNASLTNMKFINCYVGVYYNNTLGGSLTNPMFASCRSAVQIAQTAPVLVTNGKFGLDYPNIGDTGAQNVYHFSVMAKGMGSVLTTDCKFGTPTTSLILNLANGIAGAFSLALANKGIDPSVQEVYSPAGNMFRDNSFYRGGAPSLRVEPSSASNPVTFSVNVFAPNLAPIAVSGYIWLDPNYTAGGAGTYSLPTVTLSGLGITPSVWTAGSATGVWQQFVCSGTQLTGTDGVLTLSFSFQSSGAGAKAWVDDISAPVPQAVNVGTLGYWQNALPITAVLANFVAAIDIWNTMKNQLTLDGSIGQHVTRLHDRLRRR